MPLLTKFVEITLSGKTLKHYENLGYPIPRRIDNRGRNNIPKNSKISVKVEDLQLNSHVIIEYQCNNCKKYPLSRTWYDYNINIKEDGETYCKSCTLKLFSNKRSFETRLINGTSFYSWCNINDELIILNLWDDKLNDFNPDEILYSSHKKAYFKCPLGIHESEEKSINAFTNGYSYIQCFACQTLGFNYPESLNLWSDKNNKTPYEYFQKCEKIVWWKCENEIHDDYERMIKPSVLLEFRCPDCVRERDESFLQEKVRLYLEELCIEYGWNLNHEFNCQLRCINPTTNKLLRYDNEIISDNFNLIIEVHGSQHYINNSLFNKKTAKNNNTTLEKEFDYIQWKDEYKKQFALDNGYYYLAIPYIADDNNNTWKLMIDDMLNFIYENINE